MTARRCLPGLLVFGLALALRLWQIDLTRFADDQATLLGTAAAIVATGHIPATDGLSFTIGVRHPPLAAIILAIPTAISRNPIAASAFTALLDSIAALFVYLSARAIGGLKAGLFAGLLYALEPAAIVYGRTIWNPDFVPFFAAIALLGMLEFSRRGSLLWQGIALLAIGCGMQLHPQVAALLPIWIVLAAWKRQVGWSSLAALLLLALSLAPYISLQIQEGGPDVAGAMRYLAATKVTDTQVFAALLDLFSGRVYQELLLPSGSSLPSFQLDVFAIYCVVVAGGLVLSMARRHQLEMLAASTFLLPVVLSIRHSGEVAPHYLLVVLPIAAVLAGLALSSIGRAELIWCALLAVAGIEYFRFQADIPDQASAAVYGPPLRYALAAADLVRTNNSTGPLYISNPEEYAGTFTYLLGHDIRAKRFDGRYTFVFPQADGLYLADAAAPFGYETLRSVGTPLATVASPSGTPAFALFRVPAGAAPDPRAFTPLGVDVDHALTLQSYAAPTLEAGRRSPLQITWRVTDSSAPTPSDLRQFAHLVDASGAVWSTDFDVRGYPRSLWQTGDVVVSQFELGIKPTAPTGGYWLETGFYEPVTGERLQQFQNGSSTGTTARIGPLKVTGVSPRAPSAQPLATFGGEIELLGVERRSGEVRLLWQTARKPRADYTIFVHVLGAAGQLIGQDDSPPQAGSYPTTLWDAGEAVEDVHRLAVPAGASLEIGLYTTPDLRRILTADGQDHVTVDA